MNLNNRLTRLQHKRLSLQRRRLIKQLTQQQYKKLLLQKKTKNKKQQINKPLQFHPKLTPKDIENLKKGQKK